MTRTLTYVEREAALRTVEAALAADPAAVEPYFERAKLLESLGRTAEAQHAYLDLLERAPTHFGGLNNFANLLERMGLRDAARLAYAEAIKWHPQNPIAYVNLGNSFLEADDLDAARSNFETALGIDPQIAEAHQGLSYVFERQGDEEAAERHRGPGFRERALTVFPYRGTGNAIPVLLLVSAAGGNIFTRDFLDDRSFLVTRAFVEFFPAGTALPDHILVFNAIADADRCGQALRAAEILLAGNPAPVINPPSRVLETGRVASAARLGTIPHLVAPRTELIARSVLLEEGAAALLDRGFSFPLLLRTPGHHTGRHFEMVHDAGALPAAIEALPGDVLTAIEYLAARGRDGKSRKYRVMILDGKLFPLHLAIASDWKVHYFSAEMEASAEYRAEEERFLGAMAEVLGSGAIAALERIGALLGLDYAGVDFGLNDRGEILLFEANAAMIVALPGTDEKWNYRRPHLSRIFEEVRNLLLLRARGAAGGTEPEGSL